MRSKPPAPAATLARAEGKSVEGAAVASVLVPVELLAFNEDDVLPAPVALDLGMSRVLRKLPRLLKFRLT